MNNKHQKDPKKYKNNKSKKVLQSQRNINESIKNVLEKVEL